VALLGLWRQRLDPRLEGHVLESSKLWSGGIERHTDQPLILRTSLDQLLAWLHVLD
jgi:hypothetical protein